MNFLAHFAFNHGPGGPAPDPYFVAGVTLPDLWPQLSRTRRLRWSVIRATPPRDSTDAALRAGLLNHVGVDRRFHTLPAFLIWQERVRADLDGGQMPAAARDFLAHLVVELALDRWLVGGDPDLPRRYYDLLARCDAAAIERRINRLAGVDARGLADVLRGFVERRFLCRLHEPDAPLRIVDFVLRLAGLAVPPETLRRVLGRAARCVDAALIWRALGASGVRGFASPTAEAAGRPAAVGG